MKPLVRVFDADGRELGRIEPVISVPVHTAGVPAYAEIEVEGTVQTLHFDRPHTAKALPNDTIQLSNFIRPKGAA